MSGLGTVEISRAECLRLLRYESFVGRVGFAVAGLVHLRPVNYIADERSVVFCTARGSVLAAISSGASIVFEVDASQPLDHSGWSVIVRGKAAEVTDQDELAFLRRGPLKSWAVPASEQWIRLDIEEISGVRIPVR